MEKHSSRFTINMGYFQNDIEQFRGKITRIELVYIDCVNGVQDIKIVDTSYLDKFKQLPYSTSYVKGLFYKEDELIGELLTDVANI